MFGEGLLTGMGITWRHFFGKKETFCYPEEKLEMTERFRGGRLVLDYRKCIACSLCSLSCPNQAIKLKIVPDAKKKRHIESYIHLMGRCLYCNLCVENCNPHALSWDKEYAIATWHEEDMTDELISAEDREYLKSIMDAAKEEAAAEMAAKAEAEHAKASAASQAATGSQQMTVTEGGGQG